MSGVADVRFLEESSGDTYTGSVIAPQYVWYTIDQLINLTKSYNRFKMHALSLEYEARSATNTNGYITIASDPDIEYAETHGMSDTTTGDFKRPMPLFQLKGVNNAKTTPVWQHCAWNIKLDRRAKYATNPWNTNTRIDFTTYDAADMRQATAGAFFIGGTANANAGAAGTNVIIGDLYQIWDVTFMDFGTAQSTGTGTTERKMTKLVSQLESFGFTRESKSPTPSRGGFTTVELESHYEGRPPIRETFIAPPSVSGRKSSSLK